MHRKKKERNHFISSINLCKERKQKETSFISFYAKKEIYAQERKNEKHFIIFINLCTERKHFINLHHFINLCTERKSFLNL